MIDYEPQKQSSGGIHCRLCGEVTDHSFQRSEVHDKAVYSVFECRICGNLTWIYSEDQDKEKAITDYELTLFPHDTIEYLSLCIVDHTRGPRKIIYEDYLRIGNEQLSLDDEGHLTVDSLKKILHDNVDRLAENLVAWSKARKR